MAGMSAPTPSFGARAGQLALRWSLGRKDLADKLFGAVKAALDDGARTRDLGGSLSTTQMGEAVLKAL